MMSITGNTVTSLSNANEASSAQWGLRMYVNQQGGRYQYLAQNTTSGLGLPTSVTQNVGEQILWEGGGPQYIGNPTTTSSTTLNFSSTTAGINFGNGRYYAVVIEGKGVGQVRRITGQTSVGSGMSLTLDSAFSVAVDQTSVIQLLTLATDCVVYNNSLTGIAENVTRNAYIGPAGVMLFGGTFNIVVDQNTLTNIRLGISIWSLTATPTSGPNQYATSSFNMVSNNTIIGSLYSMIDETEGGAAPSTNPTSDEISTNFGNVFRGNIVQSAVGDGFDVAFVGNTMTSVPDQTIGNLVVEHNTFVGAQVGMDFTVSTRTDYRGMPATGPLLNNSLIYKNSMQQNNTSATAAPAAGSKGMIIGDSQSPTLIGNTITGFQTTYSDGTPIAVTATGTPNTYTFTLTPRDIDRKGGSFNYWVDWDNNGTWEQIVPGALYVTAGNVATFTHTFTTTGMDTVTFMIATFQDVYSWTWQETLNLSSPSTINPSASLLNLAVVATPTSTNLQYSFTLVTTTLLPVSNQYIYAFDWNNDGTYDQGNFGTNTDTVVHTFAAAGPTTFTMTVVDASGNSFSEQMTIDPGTRNVYFEGSNRADAVSFVESTPGVVTTNLTEVGGFVLATPTSVTASNITGGVVADGNDGPDDLDAGGLVTLAATLIGGTGSDTLIGGPQADALWGGGPTGTMNFADASNAIIGGGGTDTIWTGTSTDVVIASVISSNNNFVQSMSAFTTESSSINGATGTVVVGPPIPNLVTLGPSTSTPSLAAVPFVGPSLPSSTPSSQPSSSRILKIGTPVMTSLSRNPTGTASIQISSSGNTSLPLNSAVVDAAVIDLHVPEDEMDPLSEWLLLD